MSSGFVKSFSLVSFFIFAASVYTEPMSLQSGEATIIYEKDLTKAAQELIKGYPDLRDELVKTLGLDADFRPIVLLVKDRDKFKEMSGSDMVIAFALPDRNLMVIDASRVYGKPFTLETTLKHELCHLVLHRGVGPIPRWFDEGVCQWSSGGVAELLADGSERDLAKAVMSERMISLSQLERFPDDGRQLILAYEESKSVVEYIVKEYGREAILGIFEYLKAGDSLNQSISKSLSVSPEDLEKNWRAHLKRKHTWFSYLSSNLYTILFALASLMTFYGFIRMIRRKRAYVDEEEEERI
jgi:hypothetical protein